MLISTIPTGGIQVVDESCKFCRCFEQGGHQVVGEGDDSNVVLSFSRYSVAVSQDVFSLFIYDKTTRSLGAFSNHVVPFPRRSGGKDCFQLFESVHSSPPSLSVTSAGTLFRTLSFSS